MHSDTDRDGLIDSIEIENWYDPFEADADGDGRLDLQEYEEGTSPYSPDKSWNDHVWDFICGLIAGDFIRDTDSLAVLFGQIVGGLTPVVADVRDVIANLAYKDYSFAILSGFGLASLVGDGAKSAGLVVKFVIKNLDDVSKISKVMEFVVRHCPKVLEPLSKNPEFVEQMRLLQSAGNLKLTKQEAEVIDEAMKKAGVAWDGILGGSVPKVTPSRLADNVLDADFLKNANAVKDKLPIWAKNKGNFGYSEVDIDGLDNTQFFAHSSIQTEIPSVKDSGISIKPESSPFKTVEVNGSNVINGEGAWPRDVDTEYKILSDIQSKLGDNPSTSGQIKLYTELEPCPSCQSVIEQFKEMYPNIDIEVIYSIKK